MQFRTARRKTFAAARLLALVLMPPTVEAYDAAIGWQPIAEATGYTLFVRYAGSSDAEAIDVGRPTADPDGLVRVVVESLPLAPGVYFSVAGYDDARTNGAVSHEVVISYERAAAVTDSDDDGLTDGREDVDPNASVDADETDPRDADSDDDGFTDGSEVLVYGTNPLDAASVPPCISGDCSAPCATSCDDANPCTLDLCELGVCVHLPATAQCDDGISCTSFDACHDGACAGVSNCSGGADCDTTLNTCMLDEIWFGGAFEPGVELRGKMTRGATYASGADDDPSADSLAPELLFALSTSSSSAGGSGDEARFQFTLPAAGQWYLWGRFYYPGAPGSNEANSFLARVDAGPRLRFGNNRDYFRHWHWGGDGMLETGTPTPLSLGTLSAGTHTLIVEKREVTPIPPRLDVLVMTRYASWRPADEAALTALADVLPAPIPVSTTTLPAPTTTTTLWEPEPTTTSTSTTTTLEPIPDTSTSTTTSTTTSTLPPECLDASDCDDSAVCTSDTCVAGECVHAAASGVPCNDGDPCTVGDACSVGACAGWVLDCSHLDAQCTYGVCDPQLSECTAVEVAQGTSCNDDSACTTGDVCNAGVCRGVESCVAGTYCDAVTKTCKVRTEIWLSAANDETAVFAGAMTSSTRYADGDDVDVAGDSIEPLLVYANSIKSDTRGTSGDRVSYAIDLPASGSWYLWGRFYYPGRPGSNDANSFTVRVDGGSALSFGNSKGYFRRWHFGGDGRYETGTPVALPLGQLAAGPHTLTIIKREVSPVPPRLDVLVLTQNPTWVPTDVDVTIP